MPPRKLLVAPKFSRLALAACLLLLLAGPPLAHAQDRLRFTDGHVQEGKVTGVSGNNVLMTIEAGAGKGQISFDLRLISRVDVAPPPAFQSGYAAYQKGKWDEALAALKPLVDQFRSLPTFWEKAAVAALGDIYLEKGDIAKAEAAYNDFRNYYPFGAENALHGNLAQARIAMARNNPAAAKQRLEPIAKAALENPAAVSAANGAAYGKAFVLLGKIHEQEGNRQGALEDYLRTVTLFYQDKTATAAAQKSADALRAANKDLTAP
jgi:tetratricopeptide (TPR) repeat protein